MLGLLTRANAIRCRARGLSLIPPDDGIGGVGYCGADPGNWDTWSPWPTHSYCRFYVVGYVVPIAKAVLEQFERYQYGMS